MAANLEGVRIEGLDALNAKLREIPRVLRNRVLRNALAAGAREVRDTARRNAPLLSGATKAPYRQRGTVQKAITVRTSKQAKRAGDVGVFVNVRPAKAGQRGAKSPTDPFYWRWLEFGWNPGGRGAAGKRTRRALNKSGAPKAQPGRGFLKAGAGRLGESLRIFEQKMGVWFAKTNQSGSVQP